MGRHERPLLVTLEQGAAARRKFLDQPDRLLMIPAARFTQNFHREIMQARIVANHHKRARPVIVTDCFGQAAHTGQIERLHRPDLFPFDHFGHF